MARWKRFLRGLLLTTLTMLTMASLFLFIGLPALLRSGWLNSMIERKLSAVLGKEVSIGVLDLPDPFTLVVERCAINEPSPLVHRAGVGSITVAFARLPAPLGDIVSIDVDRPSAIVALDEESVRRLMTRSGGEARGESFRIPGRLDLPPIRVSNGSINGVLEGRDFAISGLKGSLIPRDDGALLPFALSGNIAGEGPDSFFIRGTATLSPSMGNVKIDDLRLGAFHAAMGVGSSDGAVTDGYAAIDSFRIVDRVRRTLKNLLGVDLQAEIAVTASADLAGEDGEIYKIDGMLGAFELVSDKIQVKGGRGRVDFKGMLKRREHRYRLEAEAGNIDFTLFGSNRVTARKASIDLMTTPVDDGETAARGTIRLDQCSIVTAVPETETSHLNGLVDFDLRLARNNEVVRGSVRVRLGDFEFLASTPASVVYQNLADAAVEIAWDGSYDRPAGAVTIDRGALSLKEVGTVNVSGVVRRDACDLNVSAVDLRSERLLARLRESLRLPESLKCAGNFSVSASLKTTASSTRIEGAISADDMDLEWHGIAARNLFFRLPLILSKGGDRPAKPATEIFGGAGCSSLTLTSGEHVDTLLKGAIFGVVSTENGIEIMPPPPFPIFGGEMRLGGIRVDNIADTPRLRTTLALDDVRLEKLLRRLGAAREVVGTVDAPSLEFLYDGKDARLSGVISTRVFGGEVRVEDVTIENALGDVPTAMIRRIDLRDVHLREISRSLIDIGAIHGVVEGSVANLRMYKDAPISFEVDVRSVPREGIEQKLNIRAVKRMMHLGEGARGLAALKYHALPKALFYSHFGFHAVLWNERVCVRGRYYEDPSTGEIKAYEDDFLRGCGVIEGAREYLMVGTTLHRINITNAAPGRTIGYETLVARIRQLASAAQDEAEKEP